MATLNDGPAADAVRQASTLVAQAINTLVALGPDAPMSVREALAPLGSAYSILGMADPAVTWSIPREESR